MKKMTDIATEVIPTVQNKAVVTKNTTESFA